VKRTLVLIITILFTTVTNVFADQIGLKWRYSFADSISVLSGYQHDNVTTLVTTQGMTGISSLNGDVVWNHDFPIFDGYSIGLPVFGKGVAVYILYLNRKTVENLDNGIVQLTAIDQKDGSILWSAYLPGYLPLTKNISQDYLYLTCYQTRELLKPNQILGLWKRGFADRYNTWLLTLDVFTGEIKWHVKTNEWSHYLRSIDQIDYFSRYERRGNDWKTFLDARNPEDGALIWASNIGYDRSNYIALLPHPRGIVAVSDESEKSFSHLIHKVSGEAISKFRFSPGSVSFVEDTLWNCSVIDADRFESKYNILGIDWNGFRKLKNRSNGISFNSGDLWLRNPSVSDRIDNDPSFWSFMQPQLTKRYKTPLRLNSDDNQKVLFYPNDTPTIDSTGIFHRGKQLYLASVLERIAKWRRISHNEVENSQWEFEIEDVHQQPIWLNSIYNATVITAYDGAVLAIDPDNGESYLVEPRWGGTLSLSMFNHRGGFSVVTNRGLNYYHLLKESVKPIPKQEVVVASPPKVVVPVILSLPEPEPEKKPEYVKQEVYRAQIMFLMKTSLNRAEALAGNISKKLGLEVHVVQDSKGIRLQAGDFIKKSEAIIALRKIRKSKYSDAFLVRVTIEVLKND
jgi:hypothetical protein